MTGIHRITQASECPQLLLDFFDRQKNLPAGERNRSSVSAFRIVSARSVRRIS